VLQNIRVFLSDMDGTFYLGNRLLPGALDFAETLTKQGKNLYFLTNNSSHRATFYVQKLQRLGLRDFTEEHIITSTDACIFYLKKNYPGSRVFLLASREVSIDFLRAGFILVQENPDIVVLCFDTTLTYSRLAKACVFLRKGIPFFATHPDLNCPTESEPLIDAGSIAEAIKAATGTNPPVLWEALSGNGGVRPLAHGSKQRRSCHSRRPAVHRHRHGTASRHHHHSSTLPGRPAVRISGPLRGSQTLYLPPLKN